MNILDVTDEILAVTGTVALRKMARELGLKGLSSARGETIREAVKAARDEARLAEEIAEFGKETVQAAIAQEAEMAKAEGTEPTEVLTKAVTDDEEKKARRSRRGMVIVAKGTEIHKSETFRVAAEANGWTVEVTRTTDVIEEDGEEFETELYVAIAKREDDEIELAWEGRAYNYPNSSALLGGKSRKVRNLKEALRFLAK